MAAISKLSSQCYGVTVTFNKNLKNEINTIAHCWPVKLLNDILKQNELSASVFKEQNTFGTCHLHTNPYCAFCKNSLEFRFGKEVKYFSLVSI